MKSLKSLTLGNYIRAQVPTNNSLFTPLTSVFQDSQNMWSFLRDYEGIFKNTPVLDNVIPNLGLDGKSLLVDMNSTSGFLYQANENRPKTVLESIDELYRTVDTSILNSDVQTELSSVKNILGLARFYDNVPSSEESVDYDLGIINLKLSQLAGDIFNRNTSINATQDELIYSLNEDGLQTQATSIKDLIDLLIAEHGGLSKVNHEHVASNHVWATSIDDSVFIPGGTEKYTTVFATGNILTDFISSQKFYNPFNKDVKITLSSTVVTENTLLNTASVVLLLNGSPTAFDIKVLPGELGQFKNDLVEATLEPNDYIQFKISTGASTTGQIKISNLSIIIEETE